jgi:hypothetical protein
VGSDSKENVNGGTSQPDGAAWPIRFSSKPGVPVEVYEAPLAKVRER